MDVLVVGGRGVFGSAIVAALRRVPHTTVTVGSRHPDPAAIRLDLRDPAAFPAFDRFDAVVNATDTTAVSPRAALLACLRAGTRFIETTADARAIRELLLLRHLPRAADLRGTAILGSGLFPGLATLMASELVRAGRARRSLVIGIRLDVASAAGRGMQRLMWQVAQSPPISYEGGRARRDVPFAPGLRIRGHGREHALLRVDLADVPLLHESLGVATVAAGVAVPWPARRLTAALGALVNRSPLLRTVAEPGALSLFALARGKLLRHRHTRVTVAVHGDDAHDHIERRFRDGLGAAAQAVAATVAACHAQPPPPGVYAIPEVLRLATLEQRMPGTAVPAA